MTAKPGDRPLSPHISVYRWEINMMMSIMHRATGVALAIGTLLVTYWLMAAATSPEAYAQATACLSHPVGQLMLFGWSFALYFHLFSGIRHLAYDLGWLFPLKAANTAAVVVVLAALGMTAATWLLACQA